MSLANPGPTKKKYRNFNGDPWVICIFLFGGGIIYRETPELHSIVESTALGLAGVVAAVNYSNVCRDVRELVGNESYSFLDVIPYQQILAAIVLVGSLLFIGSEKHPYYLPFFVAVIYFLYCLTNWRVCKIITENDNEQTQSIRAILVLAQNYFFLNGENSLSLASYLFLVVLVLLAIGVKSVTGFSIMNSDQLSVFVAGAAIFHLMISASRFYLLAALRPDHAVFTELIRAYDAELKKADGSGAKPASGRELFFTLFGTKIQGNVRLLVILLLATAIVGILVVIVPFSIDHSYLGHALPGLNIPHAD